MNHTKRLLALLLTLLLAFTLALPAFAEDDPPEEPDPAMPVITRQPQAGKWRFLEGVNISLEAQIPNGDPIGYIWHIRYEDGSEKSLTGYGLAILVDYGATFTVEVYNKANPEYRVTSESLRLEMTWMMKFLDVLGDFIWENDFAWNLYSAISGIGVSLFLFLTPIGWVGLTFLFILFFGAWTQSIFK